MSQKFILPICWWCRHFDVVRFEEHPLIPMCKAFPQGIPEKIFASLHDHRFPFHNDQGIHVKAYKDEYQIMEFLRKSKVKPFKLLEIMLYGLEEMRRNGTATPEIDAQDDLPTETFVEMYLRVLREANMQESEK